MIKCFLVEIGIGNYSVHNQSINTNAHAHVLYTYYVT